MRTIFALVALALAAPAVGREEDPLPALLAQVSPERLQASVEALVAFGTRHTLSETESDTRGIGAARRWVKRALEAASAESGGRLLVREQRETLQLRVGRARVEVEVVNVYGFLPGKDVEPNGRTYVVSGHYDSRAGRGSDATSDAPGADDDASGTAVVLELARVLSQHEFDANLIFLCVAAEEQGLHGARMFDAWAQEQGLDIDAFITNDIVGGVEGGGGRADRKTLRVFSGAEGLHSPSRELARAIQLSAARYVPDVQVRLVFRLDRFGRGGDHIPLHNRGVPAVRFTEAYEHYARQHQDVRVEDGVAYGDLPEFVDPDYMALVARVNGAALGELALAPAPPSTLVLRGAVRYDTELRWQASPDAVEGYELVWRDTTAPLWEHARAVGDETRAVLPVLADGNFFGVRAVGAGGHRSRIAYPGDA
jgi:hypothetical protein